MQEEAKRAEYLRGLYDDLNHIAREKPLTFRQALQLVRLAHACEGPDAFGRFDKYLYPFYRRDIDNGTLTEEEAYGYIRCFLDKVEKAGDIQNMTLGGLMPDGSLAYNSLTRLALKGVRESGYASPNLCFRVSSAMPEQWWDEIALSLSTGQGLPALYNDDVTVAQLIDDGIPLEDARDYCLAGHG